MTSLRKSEKREKLRRKKKYDMRGASKQWLQDQKNAILKRINALPQQKTTRRRNTPSGKDTGTHYG